MTIEQIIRAWRDPEYRRTLSDDALAALPQNPAGAIELSDDALSSVVGAHPHHTHSYSNAMQPNRKTFRLPNVQTYSYSKSYSR